MKTQLVLILSLFSFLLHAEENAALSAVKAADAARIAAMTSPDAAKLDAIFSDELRYAHSSGVVDSKASMIESLVQGKTKYLSYRYDEQNFTFPAPGIALMTGRAPLKVSTPDGELDLTLGFLAAWRLENGQWRFLAWQSCKLPANAKQ